MHLSADQLLDALRAAGYRSTAARKAVCEVVAAAHDRHLTAADVLAATSAAGTRVDRATVYRTLEALEEAGILRHGHIGHGPTVYHLAEERPHQHLVCRRCGTTVAIPREELEVFLREIVERTGFVPDDHFALGGFCRDCVT